jgi:hypothetical protein
MDAGLVVVGSLERLELLLDLLVKAVVAVIYARPFLISRRWHMPDFSRTSQWYFRFLILYETKSILFAVVWLRRSPRVDEFSRWR